MVARLFFIELTHSNDARTAIGYALKLHQFNSIQRDVRGGNQVAHGGNEQLLGQARCSPDGNAIRVTKLRRAFQHVVRRSLVAFEYTWYEIRPESAAQLSPGVEIVTPGC